MLETRTGFTQGACRAPVANFMTMAS